MCATRFASWRSLVPIRSCKKPQGVSVGRAVDAGQIQWPGVESPGHFQLYEGSNAGGLVSAGRPQHGYDFIMLQGLFFEQCI